MRRLGEERGELVILGLLHHIGIIPDRLERANLTANKRSMEGSARSVNWRLLTKGCGRYRKVAVSWEKIFLTLQGQPMEK